jgi:ubiquinone/menaquinone biosynthesis C-methylase UbiE
MRANAEELPFSDQQFDRYLANFVLHLVPDPSKMLKEAYRVLKPSTFSLQSRCLFVMCCELRLFCLLVSLYIC